MAEKVEEAAIAVNSFLGDGSGVTPARRRCVAAILRHKADAAIVPLRNMGFPDWQCRAAIMSFGSNVDAAVSWQGGHSEQPLH